MPADFHKSPLLLPGIGLLALFALPQTASANAGTPMVMGTAAHLFAGNAVIGIIEGLLLSSLFRADRNRSMLLMILANYVSAWLGAFGLPLAASYLPIDLSNLQLWLWILAGAAYCLTLLIEWPFVVQALQTRRRSILASLTVQTVSYILLFGFYRTFLTTPFTQGTRVVPSADMPLPSSLAVYYIGAENGNVFCLRPSTGKSELVHPLQSPGQNDRLIWRRDEANPLKGDLLLGRGDNLRRSDQLELQKALPGISAANQHPNRNTWGNFGKVERLGPPPESTAWECSVGFWPGEGLRCQKRPTEEKAPHPNANSFEATGERHAITGPSVRLALETPVVSWAVRNAVQLPGDKVLFQFGENQICVFDPESNSLALLCHGRGPLALLLPDK